MDKDVEKLLLPDKVCFQCKDVINLEMIYRLDELVKSIELNEYFTSIEKIQPQLGDGLNMVALHFN